MPSAVKKAIAAARSSTTTLTWSNLLIVMSLAWQRPCAAEDGQLLAAGVRELHAQPETERGGRHSRCGCGPRWCPSLQARPTSCYRGDRPDEGATGRTLDPFLTRAPSVRRRVGWATLTEFAHAIREGREPECSGHDNLGTIALMSAAVESSDRGTPVTISGGS